MDPFCLTEDDIVDILHVKNEKKLDCNKNKDSIIEIEYNTLSKLNKNELNEELINIEDTFICTVKSKPNNLCEPAVKNIHWSDSKHNEVRNLEVKNEFGSKLSEKGEAKNDLESSIQGDLHNIKTELKDSAWENETNSKSRNYTFCVIPAKEKTEHSSSVNTAQIWDKSILHTEVMIKEEKQPEESARATIIDDPVPKENVALKNLKVVLKRMNVTSTSKNQERNVLTRRNEEEPDKIQKLRRKLSYYKVLENDKIEEMIYSIYKCKKCDYVTIEQNAFKKHLVIHETGDENLKCKLCKYEAQDEFSFKKHIESCVENKVKQRIYMCSMCQFETLKEDKYKLHLKKKHKNQGHIQCTECPYSAKTRAQVNIHIRRKHERIERVDWRCTKCAFTSKYRITVVRHEKQKHNIGKLKEYKCSQCDYTSVYTSNITRHRKMVHCSGNFIFKCDQCSFQTKYKDHIEPHIRHHLTSEGANFACEFCDYKTVYRQNLHRHRQQKHSDPNELNKKHCLHCDHRCRNDYDLKRHVNLVHCHSDEQVKYKCKECSYFSTSKRYLKLHMMRLHLDRKLCENFTCDICAVSYITRSELKNHILVRHVAVFQCADCDVVYKKRVDIINHIRKKHKTRMSRDSKGKERQTDKRRT